MFVSGIYDPLLRHMLHRYIILIMIASLATLSAIAQPNLGLETLPLRYSVYWMKVCDTSGVERGSAGSGQVWSYANLVQRGTDSTRTVITNRSDLTPELQQRFPNAEFVVIDDSTTWLYQMTPTVLRLDGRVTPNTMFMVSLDPYDVRPSEVVFNDPKIDTYDGTFESTMLPPDPKLISGSHVFTYDGFGRLVLPDFTYDNVARISQSDTSLTVFAEGQQQRFLRVASHTTTWQQLNTSIPLLLIEESVTDVVDSSGVPLMPRSLQKTVRYLDRNSQTSVDAEPAETLVVAPSPASTDNVMVLGQGVLSSTVVVINAIGEVLPCSTTVGDDGITIDISQLACGSYTVLLINEQPYGVQVRSTSFIRQ